jgi:hypothetical protein
MAKNVFLDKKWCNQHLKEIKQKAGERYTPELNVELPIAEIFDGISRTKSFYTSIRKHFGNLSRKFGYLSSKHESTRINKIYGKLSKEISDLSKFLSGVKEFNTDPIPWKNVGERSHKALELSWKLSNKLRDEKEKNEREKLQKKERDSHPSPSYRLGSDIHNIYETQKGLRYFEELALSTKAKLSNTPLLLLMGSAGTGKTHLLCDLVENRFNEKTQLPAILVFGEDFQTGKDLWQQIIVQTGLDKKLDKEGFLRLLNNAGKKSKVRALLIIDALNESESPKKVWRKNLGVIVEEIKKYQHIGLIVSVRNGYENLITKKIRDRFVFKEHYGYTEGVIWNALKYYFAHYNITFPEIPLLHPEFYNPLFLKFFCEKNKNSTPDLKGGNALKDVFEDFVIEIGLEVLQKIQPGAKRRQKGKNILWDHVIKNTALWMAQNGKSYITYKDLCAIVNKYISKRNSGKVIALMERRGLLHKFKWDSKIFYKFTYNKFSDHIIVRSLLASVKSKAERIQSFSKNKKLGKLILNFKYDHGILEALCIQTPEFCNGKELFELAPYLLEDSNFEYPFRESLVWRDPKFMGGKLIDVIERNIKGENDFFLDPLLSLAPFPENPLNADFLHKHLSKFSMAKRDSWWSTFLHYQYGNQGAVDRLIEWGWSEQEKSHISDESLRLCCTALAWFLTTPNRFLRDKSTKALVALLTGKLNIVLELLKRFKDVNDPYVAERLYAIAYGCALRTKDHKKDLKDLATWIYRNIFVTGEPPVHILIRDFAKGVIEVALHQKLKMQISKNKIRPPYKSNWPARFPSNNTIKKYEFNYKDKNFKDYLWAQNSIIQSMQPEYSEISMYGDFGRYTFQSALSHFHYPINITMQKLSNWATKRVFDLGYDINLHGKFDRNLKRYYNYGRSAHKSERIGKKYQWIAFHELLALVSDHFPVKDETFFWEEKTVPYEGPWQMSIRDIDPSCDLKEFPNPKHNKYPAFRKYSDIIRYDTWNKGYSDLSWLKKTDDLPKPKKVIGMKDDKGVGWLMLEGFVEWQGETPPEQEKYDVPTRILWYMVKSYIVKKNDLKKVFSWAKRQNFMGRWMPESHEFYNIFLAEFPWAPAFLYHYIPYFHHDGWTDNTTGKKIPAKILVTDDIYLSSGSSIDCSTDEAIRVKLPAKWIVDKMRLKQDFIDGRFFNKNDELVTFDPTVFNNTLPRILLIKKKNLCDFLNLKGYAIFWTLLGEKNMIGGRMIGRLLGWLEINGAYTLNNRLKLIGSIKCNFKSPDLSTKGKGK